MSVIVVSGALANKPLNGGAAWTRLSWLLGFRELGHDVFFMEQIRPGVCVDDAGAPCALDRSINRRYFDDTATAFGLEKCALLLPEEGEGADVSIDQAMALAVQADLLVNISGNLTIDRVKSRFRRRAFIDLDPGYTQYWDEAGLGRDRLRGHDVYFTVGGNIGTPACSIPTLDIDWRPIRQPVVLREWPVVPTDGDLRFTTVASWRGPYGRVSHGGVQFGLKAHEFRKFAALPTRAPGSFEIALEVDPADNRDVALLQQQAWKLADPRAVAASPNQFREYVQHSSAEFSVAQGVYVETQSGWFSDRTVRYLASGKPALVQDTGFADTYPVGCGLLPFRTLDEAVRGAESIGSDYQTHSRAARAIAEDFFDCRKVLPGVLSAVGISG